LRSACTGFGEEHDPHAGEGVVEALAELGDLDVPAREADVVDPGILGLRPRRRDERLGDVDPERLALGADQRREPLGRVAEAATQVEGSVAGLGRMRLHRRLAVRAEPGGYEVAELDEAVEQRPAPRLHRLPVGCGNRLHPAGWYALSRGVLEAAGA
jgi:hypothetical protein